MVTNRKQYMKEYRRKNRDRLIKLQRAHRAQNRKAVLQERREYYLVNREKILMQNRASRQRNKNHLQKYNQKYSIENNKRLKARRRMNMSPHLYPLKSNCEFCGSTLNLEHGHIDYDYPTIYLTVCASCNKWMDKPVKENN